LLPEVVATLIQRHQTRRRARRTAWQADVKTALPSTVTAARDTTGSVMPDAAG
jgi:hypothetical protein